MRKEKSRDAARSRRGKENYEFYELAKMLPLPSAITSQLDKASIIRLTISFLKLRDFSGFGDPPWSRDGSPTTKILKGAPLGARTIQELAMNIFEEHQGTHILQSLDGFAFALTTDARFLYISETVSIYLGLSQVELTGSSVFDFIHHQDHAEVAEQFGINISPSQSASSPASVGSDDGPCSAPGGTTGLDRPAPVMTLNNSSSYKGLERSFCIRMKSTLTKRGCHFKSTGYRVVLILCHFRPQCIFPHHRKQCPTLLGMVALAIALPPPSVHEIRLETGMFVTRLSFDFKIAHCEPRIADILDFTAEELVGRNMYSLCHGQDVQQLRKCHEDLINKGQVMSGYYRLLNKKGGFTWLQTCATVIFNNKNSEDKNIICVNYVLSCIQNETCVMDSNQLTHSTDLQPDDSSCSETDSSDKEHGESPKDCDLPTSPSRDGHSSVGDDINNQDHVTQLKSVNKHSDSSGPVEKKCVVGEIQPHELSIDDSHLNLTLESSSFLKEKHLVSIESPSDQSVLQNKTRKRKFSGDSASHSAQSEPSTSRSGSSSSLRSTSPHSNGSFIANDAISKTISPDRPLPPSSMGENVSPIINKKGKESVEHLERVQRPWKRSSISQGCAYSPTMSVKELEDVMNKHLPNSQMPGIAGSVAPPHGSPTQETMTTRMTHSPQSHQQYKSAIQWIGGSQTTLPATTLLRQLYVNRESVIRSGSHVSRPSYYGEIQGALPTPPCSGSDGSYNEQSQFILPSKITESYGVLPGYTNTAVSSNNYIDTYSAMTPPASVSPRDKFSGVTESQTFNDAANLSQMKHYVSEGSLQHLPLKPQVFVHPGSIDHSYSHPHAQQYLSHEQRQLYTHHSSSFYLYHSSGAGKPTHPNSTAWYSQPSS